MNQMPPKLREDCANDPFYQQCCITGRKNERIEYHHNLIFGGKQVQAKFCILPLLKSIHRDIVKYKERCDWIMLSRATDEELERYSRAINYKRMRDNLNKKYGRYSG